ncbi:MAG TPA: DinB family protein [Acidimicrobiia bacterium]|nr:DinB family protein [Acidimicrobiia bacterium]
MSDPIIAAARRSVADSIEVLRAAVTGADGAALNRRPAGEETNSIAVLATHALMSTRMHLHLALGQAAPPRNRAAEFAATAEAGPLLEMIDSIGAECLELLDNAAAADWGAVRSFTRADGTTTEMTAAWALIHGIDHLRGHADEASLTRHLVTAAG